MTRTAEEIIHAIENGDFYSVRHDATAPIEFNNYKVDNKGIRIELSDQATDIGWSLPGKNPARYRTYFIGKGGAVLKKDESLNPSYEFQGNELYVRVGRRIGWRGGLDPAGLDPRQTVNARTRIFSLAQGFKSLGDALRSSRYPD